MNNTNLPINPETGTIYSRAELREAFEAVQDKENWKNPIDAKIRRFQQDVTEQAIIFYAGCRPTFSTVKNGRRLKHWVRVQAVGYYVAVGA